MIKNHSLLGLLPALQILEDKGYSAESLLARHNLDLHHLSAHALIQYDAELRIFADILQLIDDPLLGLKVGAHTTLTSYGAFLMLLMSAPTMREASDLAMQFHPLTLSFSNLTRHIDKQYYEIRYTAPLLPDSLHNFVVDRDFIGVLSFLQVLIPNLDNKLIGCGVQRAKPHPHQVHTYRQLTSRQVVFSQAYSWFRFPIKLLDHTMPQGNKLANQLYKAEALQMLNIMQPVEQSFRLRIEQMLHSFEGRYPTIDEVAQQISTSARTLRRKLKGENAQFREIVDTHKQQRAKDYLCTQGFRVNQVAEKLGYADTVSFLTAFKRWTGLTPKQYLVKVKAPHQQKS